MSRLCCAIQQLLICKYLQYNTSNLNKQKSPRMITEENQPLSTQSTPIPSDSKPQSTASPPSSAPIPQVPSYFHWAYNHSNPSSQKYTTLAHSVTLTLSSTLLFILVSVGLRLYFFPYPSHAAHVQQLQPQATYIGFFLILYLLFMITSRYWQNGPIAIYEAIWACNQCMLLAAIGCFLGDSLLIRTALIVVSLDQLLWYVDIGGWIVKGKFYVGVAKYIVWPETSKIRLLTTFHHIWFLPLCLWIVHPSIKWGSFTPGIYLLSCAYTLTLAIIGRTTTPKEVIIKNPTHKQQIPVSSESPSASSSGSGSHSHSSSSTSSSHRTVYMNLNLSWQLWKDVKISFLDQLYGMLPPKLIIIVLSFFWDIGNMLGYLLFWGLESATK